MLEAIPKRLLKKQLYHCNVINKPLVGGGGPGVVGRGTGEE